MVKTWWFEQWNTMIWVSLFSLMCLVGTYGVNPTGCSIVMKFACGVGSWSRVLMSSVTSSGRVLIGKCVPFFVVRGLRTFCAMKKA